jgi:hypothetical protein
LSYSHKLVTKKYEIILLQKLTQKHTKNGQKADKMAKKAQIWIKKPQSTTIKDNILDIDCQNSPKNGQN